MVARGTSDNDEQAARTTVDNCTTAPSPKRKKDNYSKFAVRRKSSELTYFACNNSYYLILFCLAKIKQLALPQWQNRNTEKVLINYYIF
jgi:hypothetical protein